MLIPILSPVHGVISNININIGKNTITIYISPEDNHTIYAPLDGKLIKIKNEQGSWKRQIFQAYENKIARTILYIKNNKLKEPLSFYLEVGKPKYITDRIRLKDHIKVNRELVEGEEIGEIILGSLSEVHFGNLKYSNNINVHDKVIGGKTIIAYVEVETNGQCKYILTY